MEKEHIENAIAYNARVAIVLIVRQRHKAAERHQVHKKGMLRATMYCIAH